MLECVRVDGVVARVHHVVVRLGDAEGRVGACDNLESFVAAGGRDDGVCARNGGDDVLDDALRQRIGDTLDVELLCALQGCVVQPCYVLRVVVVELNV